ncbi:copper amine oxidase N-terminal domain-containing protein, partial [Anaerotignum sp.]|uniref:copper amine oxidase N-terminal domain-containing protein n=1 Tax=Anaerotignum sp. TaxID=2039241 RepID=UPI00289EA629
MIRKFRGFFLFFVICLCTVVPASAKNIVVSLDGYPLPLAAPAVVQNDRVLVPMRSVMESLGYTIIWHSDSHSVEAKKEGAHLFLTIDDPVAIVNQKSVV